MASCVIASSRVWRPQMIEEVVRRTGVACSLVTTRDALTVEYLSRMKPDYVFFPHWSYMVPQEIYEHFECVIFHMTDVPFGRGGSPLQNLIARGVCETKVSALRCVTEVDAGPVYMKRPLSLQGTAQDIYSQASRIIEDMIVEILQNRPVPRPQEGTPVAFKRRKPSEGNLADLRTVQAAYDVIRMLDAEGYPPAFLQVGKLRFEFSRPALREDRLRADVVITVINDDK